MHMLLATLLVLMQPSSIPPTSTYYTVSSVNTVNTTIRGATTPMPMQTFISHSPDASLEKIHAGVFCNLHGSWFCNRTVSWAEFGQEV